MRQTILLFIDLRYNVKREKKLNRESGETLQMIYLKEKSIGAIQSTMYYTEPILNGHLVSCDKPSMLKHEMRSTCAN